MSLFANMVGEEIIKKRKEITFFEPPVTQTKYICDNSMVNMSSQNEITNITNDKEVKIV